MGSRLTVSRLNASNAFEWWCSCRGGLVGGGGYVVVCSIFGHVSRCCECLWRFYLSVRLRGGLLVGVRCFDVVDVGGLKCELLVLLGA